MTPDPLATIDRAIEGMENLDVDRLLDGLLGLVAEVRRSLADGRLSILEVLRIGRKLIALVRSVELPGER